MRALFLSALLFVVSAEASRHRYESMIDFNQMGVGSDIYLLKIDLKINEKPRGQTEKYVWGYNEPYAETEYRCQTLVTFPAGKAHVQLIDQKTGDLLQDYVTNFDAGVSSYYEVPSLASPCGLIWKSKFQESTVMGPALHSFSYKGQPLSFYFYGVDSDVSGHLNGKSYLIDRHKVNCAEKPGDLLVHFGEPYRWVGTFSVTLQ